MSRGYACILHMHTLAVEVSIKDIVKATELDAAGQKVEKERPKYIRSHAKATVRIGFNCPVPIEKYADMPFTLRDEGKTIALGRVVKYKPVHGAATRVAELTKKLE
jgi:peptide chain release factor subunit 3